MKRLFLLIAFLSFVITSASAQNVADATEIEKKLAKLNVDALHGKLTLSEGQKEKLLVVVTQYEMNKNIIFKSEDPMDAKNKKLEELEGTHHTKVGELLSETQFKEFNSLVEEIKGD